MGPQLKVSSDRLVKLGIKPATPCLQGKLLIHYTTVAPTFWKNSFRNTIRVLNSLVPDQSWHFVEPGLGSNCLQSLSEDNTVKWVLSSVRVYAVIISKYTTKIVGTQKRQVACVHGTQDQKQSTFNTFSLIVKRVKTLEYRSYLLCNASKSQRDCYK